MSVHDKSLITEASEAVAGDLAIAIRDATDADAALWDEYLATNPAACFYHLFGWRRIVRESLGLDPIYLIASSGGKVVGVLPLVYLESRLFGRILCSMPFLNYGGPCASTERALRQLTSAAMERAGQMGVDYLELRCAGALPVDLVAATHKVSMTIALNADPDVLWNGFKSKHRTNVRRAAQEGLTVQSGGMELLEEFYSVLENSWHHLGTPLYRRDFFESVVTAFPASTRIFLCRHGSRVVNVAFNGLYGGTVEGMWAGALPAARELNANYVLYWEMIRDSCQRGYRQFHLGRSTADSGSEWFKGRWNAEARPLHWYFHRPGGGPMPALNVDNPRYRLAIAAWRRMPLWFVRRLGPRLARCIP